MMSSLPLLVVALSAALAASAPASYEMPDEDYLMDLEGKNMRDEVIVPQKRAALVLDRLLIALQKALRDEADAKSDVDRDGPRTAPLRFSNIDTNDMTGLQRRGQGPRGRVLRCYFNAVTCF